MKRYTVKYKEKTYMYKGENCEEVMKKFANRRAFGNKVIFSYNLQIYDADTRGDVWAQYYTDTRDEVLVTLVEGEKLPIVIKTAKLTRITDYNAIFEDK